MKKVLAAFLILVLLLAGYIWFFYFRSSRKIEKGPPPVALKVGKHSPAFSTSLEAVLTAYFSVSEALVNWDSTLVTKEASAVQASLAGVNLEELKVDTTGIYESAVDPLTNAKGNSESLVAATTLEEQRKTYLALSENLRDLLFVVNYETGKVYWQECASAFGEDRPGGWLSRTDTRRNPHQGAKHPVLKETALNCGELKFTIPKDSAQ